MNPDTRDQLKFFLIIFVVSIVLAVACPGSGSGGGDSWDNPGWRYDR